MDRYPESYRKIMDKYGSFMDAVFGSDNHFHNQSWSPEKIYVTFCEVSWPANDLSPSAFSIATNNFFHMYFSGNVHDESRWTATVLEMLSWAACRAPEGDIKYLFRGKEAMYKKADHWYQNTFKIPSQVGGPRHLYCPARAISNFHLKNEDINSYTEKTFKEWVYSRIKDTNENIINEELCLVTTCLVLLMFQGIVKPNEKIISCFAAKSVIVKIRNLTNINLAGIYHPPNKTLFSNSGHTFSRLNPSFMPGFYQIFSIYYYSIRNFERKTIESNLVQLLGDTCVSATKYNGLQLIKHILEVCELFNITPKDLGKELSWDRCLVNSWKRYLEYENKYLQPGAIEYSAPWCRLYNKDCCSNCGGKFNIELLFVLAAMISTKSGPGVWQSSWANSQNRESNMLVFKYYGFNLAEKFASISRDSTSDDSDESLSTSMKTMKLSGGCK